MLKTYYVSVIEYVFKKMKHDKTIWTNNLCEDDQKVDQQGVKTFWANLPTVASKVKPVI